MEKVEVVKKDNRVYVVTPEGEIPRKQWVIDRFNEDNKRSDIAKALGVPIQTVFGYTKGMQNAHHVPGEGGFGGGAPVTVINPLTGEEMPRGQAIRELYASGMARGEIAKTLETSYQVVYNITKVKKANAEEILDGEVEDEKVSDDPEIANIL